MEKLFLSRYAKYILALVMLFFFSNIYSQNGKGQIWKCNTMESNLKISSSTTLATVAVIFDTSPKIINVFVHVINRDNGTGGLTNAQIDNWLSLFCSDYLTRNISIRVIGRANLNNTTFFNGMTNTNYSNLITTDTHSDAIDVYLLSPADTYSRASGIPGIALAVGGAYQGTSVLSHEFGHCLGLFHTHSGRGCDDFVNCAENTDESNCSTCGDLICDTPTDPCLSGNVNGNCEYTGNSDFHPDIHNIMSYAPPTCLDRLTTGQMERIHSNIMNSSILLARSFDPDVSGPSLICSSSTFTVSNVPPGCTVTWGKSDNLSYTSQSGNPKTFTANGTGSGWVQASINSGTCGTVTLPRQTVWVGKPTVYAYGNHLVGLNNQPISTFCLGKANECKAVHPAGEAYIDTWEWRITGGGSIYPYNYSTFDYATVYPGSASSRVEIRAHNACGWTDWAAQWAQVVSCYTYSLSISPNPATGEATIELVSTSEEKAAVAPEWGLEVYSPGQSLKTKTTKLKGKTYKLNTSGWKNGVYIVRAKIGDEIITEKLVVKH